MLYYIAMTDINPFEPYVCKKKPIDEIRNDVHNLMIDVKGIKSDIRYIKEYIRKIEIRKQIQEEKEKKQEAEYVKPSNSWFW